MLTDMTRDDNKNTTPLFDSPLQLLHPPKIKAKERRGFTMFGSKEASERQAEKKWWKKGKMGQIKENSIWIPDKRQRR